jgi:transcription antitermination factor NusG
MVAQQLLRKDVESFLPLYRSVRQWNKRRAEVDLPLFPGYLFVRIAAREQLRVLELPGVVHIVSFNGVPAAVPDEELELLQRALSLRQSEPHPYLTAGRRVRIRQGPLAGLEGVVVRQNSDARIIVSVDFIQRSVSLELHPSDLKCLG